MAGRPEDRDARVDLFHASAGERTVPGIWHENYWFRRHEVAYGLAGAVAASLDHDDARAPLVVDAGCGEGYGAAVLAGIAARVVALDYDGQAMAHLATCYPELSGIRGNLVGLPLADDTVDLVVSLQTLEHLWDPQAFIRECGRVLRPGGRLLLSTPNRLTFPAGNVFHHRELDADELADLLSTAFTGVSVSGVHHGARLRAWERRHGSIVDAQIASSPDQWVSPLIDAVTSVTAADFDLRPDVADSQDLLAQAIAP